MRVRIAGRDGQVGQSRQSAHWFPTARYHFFACSSQFSPCRALPPARYTSTDLIDESLDLNLYGISISAARLLSWSPPPSTHPPVWILVFPLQTSSLFSKPLLSSPHLLSPPEKKSARVCAAQARTDRIPPPPLLARSPSSFLTEFEISCSHSHSPHRASPLSLRPPAAKPLSPTAPSGLLQSAGSNTRQLSVAVATVSHSIDFPILQLLGLWSLRTNPSRFIAWSASLGPVFSPSALRVPGGHTVPLSLNLTGKPNK